jgi:exodeoxyribonuclease X
MSHKEDFLQSCLILDTETTGKDYRTAEIIESGFVIREDDSWTIFQELHKPAHGSVPTEVSALCYITNKMVEDKPAFVDSQETFQSVVNGYFGGYLVAHNHFYDMRVLARHGIDTSHHNWLCTWRLSKKLFSEMPDIEQTSLPYLRFALDLDVPIEMMCHRAGNDSFMTGKLLEVLVDLMESTGIIDIGKPYGPQITAWAEEPILYKSMPFGKHKGVPMEEVPPSYWQWAIKNTDWFNDQADNYDPDLAMSINAVLGN